MKGYIFDLDGTLVDSMWVWEDLAEVYLRARGIKGLDNISETLNTMTMKAAIDYLKEVYAIEDSLEQMSDDIYAIIRRRYRQEVKAKAGARDCLCRLKAAGMRMGVLTACERICAEQVLEQNGLLGYMDFIASCEELPYDKQDGRLFDLMLKRLQTDKEETMFVEDALHAVRTLKKHGFHVTAVYDASGKEQWTELCTLADVSLHSLEELKPIHPMTTESRNKAENMTRRDI